VIETIRFSDNGFSSTSREAETPAAKSPVPHDSRERSDRLKPEPVKRERTVTQKPDFIENNFH